MKNLETPRLRLRPFEETDFPLILGISSDSNTVRYLYHWGHPGTTPEADAHRFLNYAITAARETPVRSREYALVLKETGEAIGDGSIETLDAETGEIGWILLPAHRGKGYVTEMARELLRYGFEELGLRRIIAHADERNAPSWRVMERLRMRREGVSLETRPAKTAGGRKGDEVTYAILKEEWLLGLEIDQYLKLPCHFEQFFPLPELTDGHIRLICAKKLPADPVKKYVPAYQFLITQGSEKIGQIDLRIGYPESLFYGGQIGYSVDAPHRGKGYAGAACRLLAPVMRAHGMHTALITNDVRNAASRRVCEKLGARFVGQARLPEGHDLRAEGQDRVNIFAFEIGEA